MGLWTRDGCTGGDAGAIGQAKCLRLTHPGNPATAGRRGRRPLRVSARRRYQHRGKQMRKGNRLRPPLGSPERGAVTAQSAVTEGLVQRRYDAITLSVNPRRSGMSVGRRAKPVPSVDRRRRTGDGAPYDVWESISVKPMQSVHRCKGRRGRRPLRGVRVGTFQRSREVGGQFGHSLPHPLRFMPQARFRCRP